MAVLNPKEEIISLLRGYFTCPLISFLGKRGILSKLIEDDFSINEFKEITNLKSFCSILTYFKSIGLLEQINENKYRTTEVGKKIFRRYGAFNLLHSYGNFLNLLEKIIFEKNYTGKPSVDRLENVIGSGQINGKKFFPSAIEMMKQNNKLSKVIDIACGNGFFLKNDLENFPSCKIGAVDISQEAIEETQKNLTSTFNNIDLTTVLSDGNKVSNWLPLNIDADNHNGKGVIITMWYFLHEISKRNPDVIIRFFKSIYKIAPLAEIIIGEITLVPTDVLVKTRYETIMPEFLFFHEISGQGVLSWQDYQNILKQIPYNLSGEKIFDVLKCDGNETPSGFVWHLTPINKK